MVTQKDDVQFRRKRELLDPLSRYTLRLTIRSMCEMGSETTITLDFPLFQSEALHLSLYPIDRIMTCL